MTYDILQIAQIYNVTSLETVQIEHDIITNRVNITLYHYKGHKYNVTSLEIVQIEHDVITNNANTT